MNFPHGITCRKSLYVLHHKPFAAAMQAANFKFALKNQYIFYCNQDILFLTAAKYPPQLKQFYFPKTGMSERWITVSTGLSTNCTDLSKLLHR